MSPLNIRSDTLSIFLHSALLRNDPVPAKVRKIMQKYGNNYTSLDDSNVLDSDVDDDSSIDSESDMSCLPMSDPSFIAM